MMDVVDAMRTFFEGASGRAFVAKAAMEQASAVQERREAWARELDAINATALAEVRQFEQARARLIAAEKPIEQQLQDMRNARLRLAGERRDAVLAYDRRRNTLERQLEDTAPPAIDDAVDALRAHLGLTPLLRDRVTQRNVNEGENLLWSNFQSLDARVAAIRPAIQACQDLALLALTPKALAQRIATIHAGLPKVETRPERLREGAA